MLLQVTTFILYFRTLYKLLETLWKLYVFTNVSHLEIRSNFGILCSDAVEYFEKGFHENRSIDFFKNCKKLKKS